MSRPRPIYGQSDGYGRYGILDRDDDGRLLCHECGRWWQQLATHTLGAHGAPAAAYREAHGLSTGTRLAGDRVRAKLVARWQEADRGQRLARLAEHRDLDAARAAGAVPGSQWRAELVARRMATGAARRVDLTDDQAVELGDVTDIPTWARRVRHLVARDGVSLAAVARASGLATATVSQRLRRYPEPPRDHLECLAAVPVPPSASGSTPGALADRP